MSVYFTYSEVAFSEAKDERNRGAPLEGRSERMSEDIRPPNLPRYMEDANVCVYVCIGKCVYCRICHRVFTRACVIYVWLELIKSDLEQYSGN